MAHKSGFIDYRLEGSKVTWRHSPRGTKVALVSERDIRSDKRLGCLSAVFFFVGGAWGFARLFYLTVYRAVRRSRLRGVLYIDRSGIRTRGTRLLRVKSVQWRESEVLLLEPFTFRHRPWFIRLLGIGSTSTPAYRLSSVLLNSLPNGEVGVDAAWHAHRTALQRAPLESARHAGPEHAGAQWLQSFLHLEIALRVAQRIAKDSQLPLIDATRAPEALVSTVKATAYDVKSQGAISLASQQEAGLISLSEDEQSEEQGLVTVEQTAEGSPEIASAIRPKRVRVTRNGDSSEIRFFSLSLRTIVMSLVTTLLLGGVWTGLWSVLWFNAVGEDELMRWHRTLAPADIAIALVILGGHFVPPIAWLFGSAWRWAWRHVVLRCDPKQVAVLRSTEYTSQLWMTWDEVFEMALEDHPGPALHTDSLRIRTKTQLVTLKVPAGTGAWLLEELERWCSRAAWAQRQNSREK